MRAHFTHESKTDFKTTEHRRTTLAVRRTGFRIPLSGSEVRTPKLPLPQPYPWPGKFGPRFRPREVREPQAKTQLKPKRKLAPVQQYERSPGIPLSLSWPSPLPLLSLSAGRPVARKHAVRRRGGTKLRGLKRALWVPEGSLAGSFWVCVLRCGRAPGVRESPKK
jgi:hypothetical protein